jgi:hypothetical protein
MPEIAEAQSQPIPKRDDFRDKDLRGNDSLDKGLTDKQAFAQVEKWMAMIRELSFERPGQAKFRG